MVTFGANIYTKLERSAPKIQFSVKTLQKMPKQAFLACILKNFVSSPFFFENRPLLPYEKILDSLPQVWMVSELIKTKVNVFYCIFLANDYNTIFNHASYQNILVIKQITNILNLISQKLSTTQGKIAIRAEQGNM